MSKLKPGDKVQLPSGSPVMTVNTVQGPRIECVWFDSELVIAQEKQSIHYGSLHREIFSADTLQVIT